MSKGANNLNRCNGIKDGKENYNFFRKTIFRQGHCGKDFAGEYA